MKRVPVDLAALADSRSSLFRQTLRRLLPVSLAVVLGGAGTPLAAEDWAPNLTFGATWHDNATNAEATADQIDSLHLGADAIASEDYPLGSSDKLRLSGVFSGEWWPKYERLAFASFGGRAGWHHTFGTGPLAPVLSAEVGGGWLEGRETGRRGALASLSVALRKRLDDRWRVALIQQFDHQYASAAVFDREVAETSVEIGRDLNPTTRVTLQALYRTGETLTFSSTPRGEVEAIARASRELATFDRPMIGYAVDGRTWGARVAFVRALDDSSAIIASYAWETTERSPVQFMNQRLAISVVTQF